MIGLRRNPRSACTRIADRHHPEYADEDTYGFSPNIDWMAGDGSGYGLLTEDCDDTDSTVYPGAPELLDIRDNDCDGEIDETFILGTLAHAVYFSPDAALTATEATTSTTPMEAALLGLINGAEQRLDVAIYDFNRVSLRDALLAAHNRGVRVRVVADNEATADLEYAPFYAALTIAGIPVITDTFSTLQHNKFAIIDGQVIWSGSTNWTDRGFSLNLNNSLVLTDTYIALAYTREFEEMFSGRFSNQKTDNTPHVFTYTNAVVEIYFSPTDEVEQRVLAAVATADDTFQFAQFYWTLESLGQLAITKFITEEVEVWGSWDLLGASNAASQDDVLCNAGVPVRVEDFSGILHHKVGVIDAFGSDPTVVTGSFNWTMAGAERNDENVLIIHNADIAAAYYDEMVRLYMASNIEPCNPPPTLAADFAANVTSGLAPLAVTFTNLSRGIITDWIWDFGDGVTTTAHMPQHVYTQTGVYTVTLSVFGEGVPDTEVKEGFVTVVDDLEFAFIYLPFVRLP